MKFEAQTISFRGKQREVPAIRLDNAVLVVRGKLLKVAQIHDEFWLDSSGVPEPLKILDQLRSMRNPPDIFTFAQRIPDVTPRYEYHMEWDGFAVTHTASYENWFERTIPADVRKKIRRAAKRGVTTEIIPYNDEVVRAIKAIYDESPYRQGRRFWHYGKDIETIREENGTYLDRSTFVGAFYEGILIGFVKLVWKDEVASTMQVISKMEHFDKSPNNALLAKTILTCSDRGIKYLTYGEYSDRLAATSLTSFKRANGFFKMDVPRYYVPLTMKGSLALRLDLHKSLRQRLPEQILAPARDLRELLYKRDVSKIVDWWNNKSRMKS